MRQGLVIGLCSMVLGGCMKPMIEQTIKGDERLTVRTDVNWFSPSFTWPSREKCVAKDGVTTVTKIDDKEHVCYGEYVEVQSSPPGFEEGAGGKAIGGGVTMATGLGAAALIGPGGLAKMGDKDSNNTTNNNDTSSNGGNSNSLSSARGEAFSNSNAAAAASGGAGGNGYGYGGKGGRGGAGGSVNNGIPMGMD